MITRAATASDRDALYALVRRFPTPTPPDEVTFSAALAERLADRNSLVAVAVYENRLCGYVSGYHHRTFYASGNAAWVDEILLDETLRGRGIGRNNHAVL